MPYIIQKILCIAAKVRIIIELQFLTSRHGELRGKQLRVLDHILSVPNREPVVGKEVLALNNRLIDLISHYRDIPHLLHLALFLLVLISELLVGSLLYPSLLPTPIPPFCKSPVSIYFFLSDTL